MASYRSYGDAGAYRSKTGVGIANTFGRNTSGGNMPSCRSSYSGITSNSTRVANKERAFGFGSPFLKKDKFEEKNTFKYSYTKDTDKGRLHSGRSSSEDVSAKSSLSNSRSSLFEKYSFSAGKTSEKPSSVLDRYNRPASRGKSREPEGISRYGSGTYPGSNFVRSYGNDGRIEKKDHPPVSYRGLRPNSGKSSREPSPEIGVKKLIPTGFIQERHLIVAQLFRPLRPNQARLQFQRDLARQLVHDFSHRETTNKRPRP
ncbi:uncharacterized protein LOC114936150 [Nylanderia fulva]|uniref:uncharacterized protein LOC114936150 n=1 Tax=Nylanderia fulva TaxID=613905 RepID=UPI0010FB0A27|nr:uncharacterized protein LOC114936150 [Nylanderia fulva]